MSGANLLEAGIVSDRSMRGQDPQLDSPAADFRLLIEPVTAARVLIARQAYLEFGRGNHPAGPNFGDCFAYALARATGEPLLFKGEEFARTDIEADRPLRSEL